jgi:hypothetical protein
MRIVERGLVKMMNNCIFVYMKKLEIHTGTKFGRLTIVKEVQPLIYPSGKPRRKFMCQCVCGKISEITINHLRTNKTKSCGCYRKDPLMNGNLKHKETISHSKGNKLSTEYMTWTNIKTRCYNPNQEFYHLYGGRGIQVCDRWLNSFENFLKDMGRKPSPEYSIERIDVDGNYEPSNCKWATPKEQANNKRRTKKTTN